MPGLNVQNEEVYDAVAVEGELLACCYFLLCVQFVSKVRESAAWKWFAHEKGSRVNLKLCLVSNQTSGGMQEVSYQSERQLLVFFTNATTAHSGSKLL